MFPTTTRAQQPGTEGPQAGDRRSLERPPGAKAWCSKCGRGWAGRSECHCAVCCRHFSGVEAFDKHRTGSDDARRCLDPETARNDGRPMFEAKFGPFGLTWRRWRDSRVPRQLPDLAEVNGAAH